MKKKIKEADVEMGAKERKLARGALNGAKSLDDEFAQALAKQGVEAYRDKSGVLKTRKIKAVKESDISGLLAASDLDKSFIITATTAEGVTKKYRVRAQSPRVAKETFKKWHSQAEILGVKEEQ